MSVVSNLPRLRQRTTGSMLLGLAVAVVAAIAVLSLWRITQQRVEIDSVRSMAMQNAVDSDANANALRKANGRLEAAGEQPVAIPAPGPAGAVGATGAAGRDGLSVTGPAGPQGVRGRDGVPGAGVNGTNGSNGTAGAAGADGAIGATGATGPAGPAGTDGATGPAGPSGADGQPPQSWTFSYLGTSYTCTRASDFDPAAPKYDCDPDAP